MLFFPGLAGYEVWRFFIDGHLQCARFGRIYGDIVIASYISP